MNIRENTLNILNNKNFTRLPLVHFGFWNETLDKWRKQKHITQEEINDGSGGEGVSVGKKLGFDFSWQAELFIPNVGLSPAFESEVIEETADGFKKILNSDGAIILQKEGAGSIPSEVGHSLTDRSNWEKEFLPRLRFTKDRIDFNKLNDYGPIEDSQFPRGLHCGSLYSMIRNWAGMEGLCYIYADDPELYKEIIDTAGNLCYETTKAVLETGVQFDYGHFWEDICFKNGPLVTPSVFRELVGPHYNRITRLLNEHGIYIVSLDCDGVIDALLPVWLDCGINTMFPIEVGTWGANIGAWRGKYGNRVKGVGGMNKNVFAYDYAAIDKEIERLRPLIEQGGFIPCPDHRIPPDAVWENVQYYCERMRSLYGY